MASKASIYLLSFSLVLTSAHAGSSFETSLKEAVAMNDWGTQVSLLLPHKGQNFEQDLQLAKALLQTEKRNESLKVLSGLFASGRDERVGKLMRIASEIFFNQETSNLHFEAIRLLSVGKHLEARDRLEQANSREPGNVLVLTRLLQCEILGGSLDQASAHLREASLYMPVSAELKAFGMKLSLMEDSGKPASGKGLVIPKRPYPLAQVPFVFVLETLKRLGRLEELRALLSALPKEHPQWTYAMNWAYVNGGMPEAFRGTLKKRIDRDLESRERFERELSHEMEQTQHYWIGYISYDDLVKNSR